MAVRKPLYFDSGEIKEMTDAMVTQIVHQTCYQYALNPSVTLTVSSVNQSATSHFPNIADTRYITGVVTVQPSGFAADPADPTITTVQWNRLIRQYLSVSPTTDTGKTWPVYYDSGSIQAMNLQDIKDTFLHPAIDLLCAAGTPGDTAGGTYMITTSSTPASGFTLVSGGNILFTDLIAAMTYDNADYAIGRSVTAEASTSAGITAGEIPDASTNAGVQTDSIQRNNYYLHIKNAAASEPTYTDPLFVTGGNDLQTFASATFKALLQEWIRETASESADGHQIQYNLNGSGNLRTNIINAILNGSGAVIKGEHEGQPSPHDDYRAQEFPVGTLVIGNTHTFNIVKG